MRTLIDLETAVDHGHLAEYLESDEGRNMCPIRLSGIGNPCARALGLLSAGHDKDPLDAKSSKVFQFGTTRGIHLANAIKRAAVDMDFEVLGTEIPVGLPLPSPDGQPWDPEEAALIRNYLGATFGGHDDPDGNDTLPVRFDGEQLVVYGRCDVAIVDAKGVVTVIDFKTTNPFAFKKLPSDGEVNDDVNESYVAQVGAYTLALANNMGLKPEQIGDPVLFFEDKGTQQSKVIFIPLAYAEQVVKKHAQKVAALLRYVVQGQAKKLPRSFEPNAKGKLPWQCAYCAASDVCWDGHGLTRKQGQGNKPDLYVASFPDPVEPEPEFNEDEARRRLEAVHAGRKSRSTTAESIDLPPPPMTVGDQ